MALLFGDYPSELQSTKFLATIDAQLLTKNQLFDELFNKLDFPGYFGFNWDALIDCLRDFEWLEDSYKGVIIHHLYLPLKDQNELKIYLDVLCIALDSWEEEKAFALTVSFPKLLEPVIAPLLPEWFVQQD